MSNYTVKFIIDEVLEQRGRSIYWLEQETGLTYAALWRTIRGKSGAIKLETLAKICNALDCEPGELLVRVPAQSAKPKKAKK